MNKKVAINGFGRIGRLTFRTLFNKPGIEIVAINDLTDAKTLAHLLKYDSAHGNWHIDTIHAGEENGQAFISVDGHKVFVYAQKDPAMLPWGKHNVDLVVESTGFYTSKETAEAHIKAGAKKVAISAPATGDLKTIVYGVNHKSLTSHDTIVSAASCTTNCLAPVAEVLDKEFGIHSGMMTTIHAYTNDQKTADAPHKDLRRARAAAANIIPTSTGAAKAIGLVLPQLKGKMDGTSLRVPTITGSIVDLQVKLNKEASVEEINAALKNAAATYLKDTLGYTVDEIVSSDIIGIKYGSLVDSKMTMKMGSGHDAMYKVFSWYDNEMSYVNQLVRTIVHMISL